MELISQGAEARIYRKDNLVIKDRFRKKYRFEELDTRLRHARTRREAKILTKLQKLKFPAPKVKQISDGKLEIEFIDGQLVKNILDNALAKRIGNLVAMLHSNDIIHGDLTTSNMIFNNRLYFIDFGLGFFSKKVEDKAVDLHLLDRAMESKHFKLYPKIFKVITDEYRMNSSGAEKVLQRLEEVSKRGRNKGKHKL